MYITDLKVNNLIQPMGIDTIPTFRWINHMSGYARFQSAYQIIVASTAEKVAMYEGDVWDSGKVQENCNYDISYGGKALDSRTVYFFAVRVWDERDNSVWSESSYFETGIFDCSEWQGKWIGGKSDKTVPIDISLDGANWIWDRKGAPANETADGAMYFRSAFEISDTKKVDRVTFGMTIDNLGTAYINGVEAAKTGTGGVAWQTGTVADITLLVKQGENCIAVYGYNIGKSYAGLVAKISVYYTDGTTDTFLTDENWRTCDTVSDGWQNSDYDDSAWIAPDQVIAYGSAPWHNVQLAKKIVVEEYPAAPMLRKSFELSGEVKRARAYVSGLGLYEMHINGQLPDDTVLNPAHTQYNKTVHYRVFDVTDMLVSGKNTVAVELGNFFYNCTVAEWHWDTAPWRDSPKLLFELLVEYTDGTTEFIVSDESWKMYSDGPTVYNGIYHGEHYDARRAVQDWEKTEFDDSSWEPVEMRDAPAGQLVFENMEPMRRIITFTPTVTENGNGTFIIENPVMTTGWAKIRFNAPKDTEIAITYGEKIVNGEFVFPKYASNALQSDKYVCSGICDEVYEPKFTYKGYRYIKIENYPGKLTSSDVECYFIANDVAVVSTFETGNKEINSMHDMVRRTIWNNFQGKPTDTPVYEKNGWTGDYNVSLEMINFNFDISNFNAKYLRDLRDCQNEDGSMPVIAPGYWNWGKDNAVVWNSAYINGIYESWRTGGLTSEIKEHYPYMRLLAASYISILEGNGWVWTDNQLSDWVAPYGPASPAEGSGICGTGYAYFAFTRLAKMADEIGEKSDADEYRNVMEKVYNAFNKKYYDAEKGYYDTGYWNNNNAGTRTKYRQTSNLVPLAFGLCPNVHKESVVSALVKDIAVDKNMHFDTGMVGTKLILTTLSEIGYGNIAMELIKQTTFPSWGFWLSNGANSTWEGWDIGARSHNHYFLGTYEDWFYKNLAGVRDMANGYETVTLCPEVYSELGYTDMTLNTVRGALRSHWYYTESGELKWEIRIPTGTTAKVYLPAKANSVNGKALDEQDGLTVNKDSLTLLSGEYVFALS